jgi:hypothetical protein
MHLQIAWSSREPLIAKELALNSNICILVSCLITNYELPMICTALAPFCDEHFHADYESFIFYLIIGAGGI